VAPVTSEAAVAPGWPAFAEGYRATLPALHAYAWRGAAGDGAVAEDVTRVTYRGAARAAGRGDPRALGLAGLLTAARAGLVDHHRRAISTVPAPEPPTGAEGVARLGPGPRAVVIGRYLDGLPTAAVAADLGLAEGQAARMLDEATTALRGDHAQDGAGDDAWIRDLVARAAVPPAGFGDDLLAELRAEYQSVAARRPAGATDRRPTAATIDRRSRRAADLVVGRPIVPHVRSTPARSPGRRVAALDPDRTARAAALARRPPLATAPAADAGRASSRVARGRGDPAHRLAAAAVVAVLAVAAVVALAGNDAGPDGGVPAEDAAGRDIPASRDAIPAVPGAPAPVRLDAPAADAPDDIPVAEPPGGWRPTEAVPLAFVSNGGSWMNGPYAVATGAEGLWVTALRPDGAWQAVRLDPADPTALLAEVPIPGRHPVALRHHGIVLAGGYAWAPLIDDGLLRIDVAAGEAITVPIEGGVDGEALAAGDGVVWAAGDDGLVRRIEAATGAVTSAGPLPEAGRSAGGVDLAFGSDRVWAVVSTQTERHLVGFDPVSMARVAHFVVPTVGPVTEAYAVAASGPTVVITEQRRTGVTVVDVAAGRVVAQHAGPVDGVAIDGGRIWLVGGRAADSLVALDPATGDPVAAYRVPREAALLAPSGPAIGTNVGLHRLVPAGGGRFYVAQPHMGRVVEVTVPG
jgi:DNA-directed RNA polymerase specialized sigma24 family protein